MNKIISVFYLLTVLTVLYSPVNDEPGKKVVTHAIVGLIPPFRFWSGYDALVDRHGGYWKGKV